MSANKQEEIKDRALYEELRIIGMRKERAIRLANANAAYKQKEKKQ